MTTQDGGLVAAASSTETRGRIAFQRNRHSGGVIESGTLLNVDWDSEGVASVSWTGVTMTIDPNAMTLLDIRLGDANNAVADYVTASS